MVDRLIGGVHGQRRYQYQSPPLSDVLTEDTKDMPNATCSHRQESLEELFGYIQSHRASTAPEVGMWKWWVPSSPETKRGLSCWAKES